MIPEQNVPLSSLTTFRVGGPARYFFDVSSVDELSKALRFASEHGIPFFILGGGSNTLFSDAGFPGVVIRVSIQGRGWEDASEGRVYLSAGAGEEWDPLVAETVSRGLYGFENLSLIPGRVGATPIQNIGAYGAEISSVVDIVEVFNTEMLCSEILTAAECGFGYRDSIFKKNAGKHLIVTKVRYCLDPRGTLRADYPDVRDHFAVAKIPVTLASLRKAVIAIRRRKFPDLSKVGTAGSFFKNPLVSKVDFDVLKKRFPAVRAFGVEDGVKVSAAWLLDHVGRFKGVFRGGAVVSDRHALVVLNRGDATSADIRALADDMRRVIKERANIELEPEVVIVEDSTRIRE